MTPTLESLVEIAKTIETPRLKAIQRHQRSRLLLAQRNHNRGMAHFLQLRVDAAAQVLNSRRAA